MAYLGNSQLRNQVVVENQFLPKDVCDSIRQKLDCIDLWEEDSDSSSQHRNALLGYSDDQSVEVHYELCNYMLLAKETVENFYGDDFLVGRPGLRKWVNGEKAEAHGDNCDENGLLVHQPKLMRSGMAVTKASRDVTVLLYLNGDFSGGRLHFPTLDLSIKPEAGMLIAAPSSRYFPHSVEKIASGVRYTAFSFFSRVKTIVHLLNPVISDKWEMAFLNSSDVSKFYDLSE